MKFTSSEHFQCKYKKKEPYIWCEYSTYTISIICIQKSVTSYFYKCIMIEIILFVSTHKKLFRSKSHFNMYMIEIIFFVFTSELWRIFCIYIISDYNSREPRVRRLLWINYNLLFPGSFLRSTLLIGIQIVWCEYYQKY